MSNPVFRSDEELENLGGDWSDLLLEEAFEINPKRTLKKGEDASYIGMADIAPWTKFVSPSEKKSFKGGTKFKNGDTIMARITPCLENGKTSYISSLKDEEIGFGSTEYIVLSGKDLVSINEFAYYHSTAPSKRREAIKCMTGSSGRQRVEQSRFNKLSTIIPPIGEQQRIAEILGSIDEQIENLTAMNQTLEDMGAALFKNWFVDFDGVTEWEPGREGELPKGWREGVLEDAINLLDSKRIPLSSAQRSKRQGNFPYHGATKVMDYVDDFIFDGEYILLAEDGSVLTQDDNPVLQHVWGKFWVSNHAHVVIHKAPFALCWIWFFFSQLNLKPYITGAVQLKLNQQNMKSILLLIPTPEKLDLFSSEFDAAWEQKKLNTYRIRNLKTMRDSLLPMLVGGRLVVNPEQA